MDRLPKVEQCQYLRSTEAARECATRAGRHRRFGGFAVFLPKRKGCGVGSQPFGLLFHTCNGGIGRTFGLMQLASDFVGGELFGGDDLQDHAGVAVRAERGRGEQVYFAGIVLAEAFDE